MTGGPDPEEGVRGRVTNKFQQSQVRPRLGGREREGEGGTQGAEQGTEPAGPHPRAPLIVTEPVLGAWHACVSTAQSSSHRAR